ncbi:hypothetical protein [Agrobacterium sp.]|uniref:hypothetical protein n=1 Tax=Agrobacterium sp. TaxID=361 RepID=UPI0028AD8292
MIKQLHLLLNSKICRYCIIAVTGLSLGLVVGFAAGGAVLKGCPAISDAPFGCVEFILSRYQTLAAGILALIGAGLLWIQIQDQRRQTAQKQKQNEIAARIRMPHALSQMSVYWKHCYDAWEASDIEGRTMEPPYDAIEVIMTAAPYADAHTFETIKRLTILSQAFEARVRPLNDLGRRERLRQMIVDIAELIYLTDSLYSYGRLETESSPYERPGRNVLEGKINSFNRFRRDAELAPVRERITEAFNHRFGRRNEAAQTTDQDDDEF